MSERFPDEVLREAHHAYTLVWDVTFDSSRDVDAANAAAIAAMRAVLDAQTCEWSEDQDSSAWQTGIMWSSQGHNMRCCPQCGAELGRNKAFTWCPNGHYLTGAASDGSQK